LGGGEKEAKEEVKEEGRGRIKEYEEGWGNRKFAWGERVWKMKLVGPIECMVEV